MSNERSKHRVDVFLAADLGTQDAERDEPAPRERPDSSFRVLVIGDFSGRAHRMPTRASTPHSDLRERRTRRVDRDDLDGVLAAIGPEVHALIAPNEEASVLRFAELDDLHPDRLSERPPYSQRLQPDASAQASMSRSPGGLLDAILEDADHSPVVRSRGDPSASLSEDVQGLIQRSLRGQVVRPETQEERTRAQTRDALVADAMRALLRSPGFQEVESLWRSVDFLVRRVDTDSSLQFFLLDATKREIADDVSSAARVDETALHALLADSAPWALVVGAFDFGESDEDAALLGGIARIAAGVQTPWVSAAHPRLIGAASLAGRLDADDWGDVPPAWDEVRRQPEARYVGLVAPRLLLRLPYGKDGEPCEHPFEEMPGGIEHDAYLWGNPAFALALVLAQAFAAEGWDMRPAQHTDIPGLPLHVRRVGGASVATSCAEALLTEGAAERMLDRGVMPLIWFNDTDRARVARLQSIANPSAPLAGRWSAARPA